MKKKNKKAGTSKKAKDETKEETAKEEAGEAAAAASTEPPAGDDAVEAGDAEEKAAEEDKPSDTSPSATPSLAQQSKLRSTSFRAGSTGGALSPGPFSPEGDTAPDIYRKHVARIEELEKENKRLTKESTDSEKRWKKAEEELADLREAEGDAGEKGTDDTEKLVCVASYGCLHAIVNRAYRRVKSRRSSARTHNCSSKSRVGATPIGPPYPSHRLRPLCKPSLIRSHRQSSLWK